MHDGTLDRTTLAEGPVNALTTEELSRVELKDPWDGVPCYVELLSKALLRVADRGLVMVDMHHAVPRTVSAVRDSVSESCFDESMLVLLTYTRAGGLLFKKEFPAAVVLLKSPHDVVPPDLTPAFVEDAEGLDGVLVPIVGETQALQDFRAATSSRGLKLAVYMHTSGAADLERLIRLEVDYVTSHMPEALGPALRATRS
jgi:glycerophosphoryl diester phosphodiesterase